MVELQWHKLEIHLLQLTPLQFFVTRFLSLMAVGICDSVALDSYISRCGSDSTHYNSSG